MRRILFLDIMKSEPLYFWFAGDVTAAMLVIKKKTISVLWKVTSIFI